MKATGFSLRIGAYLLLPLLATLISCAPIVQGGPQGDLDLARSRWRTMGSPANYSYRYQMTCFCPRELVQPVIITVRDGRVDKVVYVESQQPADPQFMSHYKTIEELFGLLQEAIDRNPDRMAVNYDPAYGYPLSANIDYSEQMADEELMFTADGFAVSR